MEMSGEEENDRVWDCKNDIPGAKRRKAANKRVNTQNATSALTPNDTKGGEQPRRGRGRMFTPSWSRSGKNRHPPPRLATEKIAIAIQEGFQAT